MSGHTTQRMHAADAGGITLEDLHRRMFVDNGTPSWQTRLSRIEQQMKLVLWISATAAVATIGQIVAAIGKAVLK